MRTVRLLVPHGPFMAGQRAAVLGSDDRGLILRGKNLMSVKDWNSDVVIHGVQENEVVDYVPDPPVKTLAEKIRTIWPM